jgi:HK97 family phage prohead protease
MHKTFAKTKALDVPLAIKALKDDGTFSGYGSVFGTQDAYDDIVAPGAFTRSLAGHKARNSMPALLWQHDPREPIGIWTDMREDERGLYVEGRLLVDEDATARRAYAHLKAGSLKGLSIGYMTRKSEYDQEKDVRTLTDVDLWEVSVVTFAANPDAQVAAVKGIKTIRDFEAFLRDAGGFSHSAAKAIAAGGFKTTSEPRDEDGGLSDLLASIKRAGTALSRS